MYQTIVVPLDGSKRAEAILPYVEELAQRFQSRVVFLRIVSPTFTLQGPEGLFTEGMIEEIRREVEAACLYLAGVQGEFREKGIEAGACVERDGSVVKAILNVAERESADLIAMASHGRTGLARVYYGSVAAGVLSQADRPLLLVRAMHEA